MRRRDLVKTAGLLGTAGVLGSGPAAARAAALQSKRNGRKEVVVRTRQRSGNSVHWILPGTRRLDGHVFGTPESGPSTPRLGDDHVAHTVWRLRDVDPEVAGLLTGDDDHDPFPVPVGWPNDLRGTDDDGTRYTRTEMPLPFSDEAVGSADNGNLDGGLDLAYRDRQGFEGDGTSPDAVDLDVWFTDPAGNRYDLEVDRLERHDGAHLHGRGVMTGAHIHGTTGIGTPLMPTQYAFGSFWAVGSVRINGEQPREQNTERTIHVMTTQTVRTEDYTLAIDRELPLGAEGNPDPFLGRSTHTHVFVPPVRHTEDGPRHVPLETAFELPNGNRQPFVHFMFDEDDVRFD